MMLTARERAKRTQPIWTNEHRVLCYVSQYGDLIRSRISRISNIEVLKVLEVLEVFFRRWRFRMVG